MATVPSAPTPPDGECTEGTNNYNYASTDGLSYTITFCTGSGVGGLSEGVKAATPAGIIPPPQCGDPGYTISDIDGNIYNTVKIGNQCWMKENLKTSQYNDGTPITTGLNNTDWSNNTTGAYAIYPHANIPGCSDDNCVLNMYGALYNWYAVSATTNGNKNICPTGWSVPTDAQWTTMNEFLDPGNYEEWCSPPDSDCGGFWPDAGGKMKETTVCGSHPCWNAPNSGANNISGFTALPAGYRSTDRSFDDVGNNAYFWSSSEDDPGYSWDRILDYTNAGVYRYYDDQAYG